MRLIDADTFMKECCDRIEVNAPHLPLYIRDFVIDEMPTVNAIPLNKKICKCSHGEFILYDRKWLYEHLRQEFNILASASGVLKRANWINVTNDESVDYEYSCSECGYCMFKDFVDQWKFCPNCGAKMR